MVKKLGHYINLILIFFAADHFCRMGSQIVKGYLKFKKCHNGSDDGFSFTSIYIHERSVIFRYVDFHYVVIPFFEWFHIARRVSWVYAEVLMIIFAINITMKLTHYYERLNRVRRQIVYDSFWRTMREHYIMLCELIESTSEFFSPLLLIVTFADFFFLCERLYKQYA
jgi:hypothetical protein